MAIYERVFLLIQLSDFKNEYTGLSDEKASEHIKLYGYNSETKLDEKEKGFSPVSVFFRLRFWLLAAAAVICFLYGEYITGAVLAVLTAAYAATEIVKGKKCDEYFFEQKKTTRVDYNIVRNGELRQIRRELLVPDDILLLEAGENVPADAHLLEINNLLVDESIFTGDKTPAAKITGADSFNEELKKSCIYKGTKIVSGRLAARVTGTGVDTKYFKTFGAEKAEERYYTATEKTVMRVSRILTLAAAVMLAFAALFHFTQIDIYAENPILNTVYNTFYPAISFALCFIPSELASIIRIYCIKGSEQLAERNVIIKDLKVIEDLSAVTCVCIDKSGTVTSNYMAVADELTASPEMMTNISVLACTKGDSEPLDKAIILNATFKGADVKTLRENELLKEYPFSRAEGAAGNLWDINGARLLCIKGAPEKLLPLCDVPSDMLYTVQNKIIAFEKQGYQVLATAFAQISDGEEPPETIHGTRYGFMGLIAFENKTKDNIPFAIRSCYKSGIRVILTTGDSPDAAVSIAEKIGIKELDVITGEQLSAAKDSGIKPDLTGVGVFARITPEQKTDVIKLLQDGGEIVAVSGNSNTDSDILEQADFAVALGGATGGAMGEACGVVMSDNDFEKVVDVFRTGRQVYANIKRCISTHITAITTLAVFAIVNMLLPGTTFILSPVLVALITLLGVPAISFMFLENNSDIRGEQRPSGFHGTGKITKRYFIRPFIQALGLCASEIVFYLISSGFGVYSKETVVDLSAQSASNFLLVLIFGLIISAWINLSEKSVIDAIKSRQTFAAIISGASILAALILVFVPYVNTAVGLASVKPMMAVIALVITLVLQIPAEVIKYSGKK